MRIDASYVVSPRIRHDRPSMDDLYGEFMMILNAWHMQGTQIQEAMVMDRSQPIFAQTGKEVFDLFWCLDQAATPSLDKKKLGKPPQTRWSECINKMTKTDSLISIANGVSSEDSIHDLDITNCNSTILEKARGIVQYCKDLLISFRQSEHEVVSSVVWILQNSNWNVVWG